MGAAPPQARQEYSREEWISALYSSSRPLLSRRPAILQRQVSFPAAVLASCLVSQLAVKSNSQDFQLWLRRQMCLVKGLAGVLL